MSGKRDADSYRTHTRIGGDPVTEADVITELIGRTTKLRALLLKLTIAGAIAGGALVVDLYWSNATRVYGRVIGAAFGVGAIVAFAALRRLSDVAARAREARWIAESARDHDLDPDALRDALAMFRH